MKNLDQWILVIIALAGIFSPVVTTFINNKHQSKMKKIELEFDKHCNQDTYVKKIFEAYIKDTYNVIQDDSSNNYLNYCNSYGIALLYADNEVMNIMIELNRLINPNDTKVYDADFNIVVEDIRKQINKY